MPEPPPQGRAGHTDRAAAGNHPGDQQPWAEPQQGSCLKNTPGKPDTKAPGDSSPSPTERRSQEPPRFRSRSRSWTLHGQITLSKATLRYHTGGARQRPPNVSYCNSKHVRRSAHPEPCPKREKER